MSIEIMNWGVEVSSAPTELNPEQAVVSERRPEAKEHRSILCDVSGRWREAAIHDRQDLQPGDRITGPALITEPQTTTLVSADFSAWIDGQYNIRLTRTQEGTS